MIALPPELALMSLGMTKGTSLREICPRCGGGSKKEKSLSLTMSEDGNLLWKCHRASCGDSGKVFVWDAISRSRVPPKKAPRAFKGLLEKLPADVLDWFFDEFELTPDFIKSTGVKFAPEENRLFLPMFGPPPKYLYRGAILREWKHPLNPKTLTYKEAVEDPFIHWGVQYSSSHPVVIVEDYISCLKLMQAGLNALSISGTHLSQRMIREILNKHKTAIIALDKDATTKAVAYAGTFRHLVSLKVWKLEEDLKYVPERRILDAYFADKIDFSED